MPGEFIAVFKIRGDLFYLLELRISPPVSAINVNRSRKKDNDEKREIIRKQLFYRGTIRVHKIN